MAMPRECFGFFPKISTTVEITVEKRRHMDKPAKFHLFNGTFLEAKPEDARIAAFVSDPQQKFA